MLHLKAFTLHYVSHLKAFSRPQKIVFSFCSFNFTSKYMKNLQKVKQACVLVEDRNGEYARFFGNQDKSTFMNWS